jgi:dihydrolipoamide dehydrogenase
MGKKFDFDYIVIGSGPAGSAVATGLAKAKKHVALVEGRYWGGSNLNTRDIPYDVALDFSHSYRKILSLPEFKNQDPSFSLPTATSHQLKVASECNGNNYKPFKTAGITCISGYANFLDSSTIAVGNQKYTAKSFILATGSRLKALEISGTKSVKFLTPETAIKTRRLPEVVVVVGGGSTGCEIASYYAELGVRVIILETAPRLLPREDKEVGTVITDYFTNELGIMVLTGSKAIALEQDSFSKRVIFVNGRSEKMIRTDCIVLATGSIPALDYGLENAGVKYKNSGIVVDRYFETSAKNIYAVGDCLGKDSSTDLADYEGSVLAANLVNKTKNPANYHGFIRHTNTSPAVVTIGLNEDDLTRRDRKYKTAIVPFSEITASKIYDAPHGFVKLIADKANHLLGACIVAPHAELLAPELSLAIRHNLTAVEIASTPHSINNYNYAIKLAAKELLNKK